MTKPLTKWDVIFWLTLLALAITVILYCWQEDEVAEAEPNEVEIVATPVSNEMYYCDGNEYKINPNAPNAAYFENRLKSFSSRVKALEAKADYGDKEYVIIPETLDESVDLRIRRRGDRSPRPKLYTDPNEVKE